MDNRLFVGNISWNSTQDDVKDFFSQAGEVEEVYLVIDKFKGTHKGFGFVTMKTEEEAQKAIDELNGKELDGREVKVDIARPRQDRSENRY